MAAAAGAAAVWLAAPGGAAPPGTPTRIGGPLPGTITTVAGGPGPVTGIPIATCPISVAGSALYAGDGAVVRRIDTRTGWLTTPAGDGTAGTRGIAGPATDAEPAAGGGLQRGMAATLDAAWNLGAWRARFQAPSGAVRPSSSAAACPLIRDAP